jgi:hypothetical protein
MHIPEDDPHWSIASDGFANAFTREAIGWNGPCPFSESPIPFLKALLALRMRGQSFDHTHVRWVTNGKALEPRHFEITKGGKRQMAVETEGSRKRRKSARHSHFIEKGEDTGMGDSQSDDLSSRLFVD